MHFEDSGDVSRRQALQRISAAIENDNRHLRSIGVPTDPTGPLKFARQPSMRGGPLVMPREGALGRMQRRQSLYQPRGTLCKPWNFWLGLGESVTFR